MPVPQYQKLEKNFMRYHLCKMHPYGFYYVLQYRSLLVFVVIEFGEGNLKKNQNGGGNESKIGIIYTPGSLKNPILKI